MSDEIIKHPSSGVDIPYSLVRHAMADQGLNRMEMSLVGHHEKQAVAECVNQGIDSHLEACFVPARGDEYYLGRRTINDWHVATTLECKVSSKSLPVLLRRLTERDYEDNDEAQSLAGDILQSLGISYLGAYERPVS